MTIESHHRMTALRGGIVPVRTDLLRLAGRSCCLTSRIPAAGQPIVAKVSRQGSGVIWYVRGHRIRDMPDLIACELLREQMQRQNKCSRTRPVAYMKPDICRLFSRLIWRANAAEIVSVILTVETPRKRFVARLPKALAKMARVFLSASSIGLVLMRSTLLHIDVSS